MLKKLLSSMLFILVLGFPTALHAGGSKESKGQSVNGLENWDYSYDIKDKKPGKYNLIIEGKDKAGNVTIAGPFNVWVDPNSDIPLVSVNNPVVNMRVGTNLNIVGTCIDDVAVDHVEIQLDDGPVLKATGSEYWSYYLDVKDIPDGKHKITVRGFDNNQTPSKPVTVSFNLDKFKPENAITSHENGFLASGTIKLKGSATDANGIAKLWISSDAGKTFKEIPVKSGKNLADAGFEYAIDTHKFTDGPQVFWIRSKDKTGSIGISAFLLFVDNTKPSIQVLRPLAAEQVNGVVSIAGMIRDVIGIKEAGWSFGGKSGTIALVPGNPYFSQAIDLSAAKDKSAQITLYAVDTIGNRSELKYQVSINREADLPILELLDLKDKDIRLPDFTVAAHVSDDDGVKAVHYTIDGKADQSQVMAESGILHLSGLTVGQHKLSFQAEDINGTLGKKVELSVTIKGGAPKIAFDTIKPGASPTGYLPDPLIGQAGPLSASPDGFPFVNGVRILADATNRITGTVSLANPVKSAEFSLDGKTWLPLSLKNGNDPVQKAFEIILPTKLGFGLLPISVRARDSADQESSLSTFVVVLDYRQTNAAPAVVFQDSRISGDAPIKLDQALIGRFVGSQPLSVRIQPPSKLISAELSGSTITIKAVADGITGPVKIVVTNQQKHDFSSAEFNLITDTTPPVITIASPQSSLRVKDTMSLSANLSDQGGIAEASYSLDAGKTWLALSLTGAATSSKIQETIALGSLVDGPLPLIVRATDKAGNEGHASLLLIKDQSPPAVNVELPATIYPGSMAVWGHVTDSDRLERLEYRTNSSSPWQALSLAGGNFAFTVDVSDQASAPEVSVRARDLTGNETIVSKNLATLSAQSPSSPSDADNKKPAKPTARLVNLGDAESAILGSPLVVALDNWSALYNKVTWSLDTKKNPVSQDIPPSGIFVINPDFSDLKSATSTLNLILEGSGKTKENLSIKLKFDPNGGRASLSLPWLAESNQEIALYAQSELGIKEIHYTIDATNETTLDKPDALIISPNNLGPGKHQLTAWAVDSAGRLGPKLDRTLNIAPSLPLIHMETALSAASNQSFVPGIDLVLDKTSQLSFTVSQAANVKELNWSINNNPAQKITFKPGSSIKAELPLSPILPWGLNLVTINGTDNNGATFSWRSFFYHLAEAGSPAQEMAANSIFINPSDLDDTQTVHLSASGALQAYFNGRTIAAVKLEPASPNFQVDFAGQLISVKGLKAATEAKRQIVVTDIDGDSWRSQEFILAFDQESPLIELADPAEGSWLLNKLPLKGSVTVGVGTPVMEYSFGDAPFTPLELKARKDAPGVFDFSSELDLTTLPDGPVILKLRATNQFGNISLIQRAYSKDSTGPVLSIISPPENEPVNGLTTIVGKATDIGRVKSIEFSSDFVQWTPVENSDLFKMDLDFSKYNAPYQFWFRAIDNSGNSTSLTPVFNIDQQSDKPVVKIQTPVEDEVIRNDFKVSGIAYDDDGIKALYWRLDSHAPVVNSNTSSGLISMEDAIASADKARALRIQSGDNPNLRKQLDSFTKLDGKNSFDIPLGMLATGDNAHLIEIVAEDIYGTLSDLTERTFRISTAEPTSQIVEPATGVTVRGSITMKGTASDNNGIASVWLSFDNGTSFVAAQGTEEWSYELDTTTLRDGNHVVIIKTIDKYDSEGLYTTLLAIDNTPPELALDTPVDGTELTAILRLSGRISDNIGLTAIHLTIVPADNPVDNRKDSLNLDLDVKTVIQQEVDISHLTPGWYTLRIEARDHADNSNWISRDIRVVGQLQDDKIEILYPLEGESVQGNFTLSGKLDSSHPLPGMLNLNVNGQSIGEFPVGHNGYFNIPLGPDQIADGKLTITANASLGPETARTQVESAPRSVDFHSTGYWVRFDLIQTGDFLTKRPYVKGSAGYFTPAVAKDSPGYAAWRKDQENHKIDRIEISLNHGVTWVPLGSNPKWQYRVETQNFPNGEFFLLVRSIAKDGSMAIARAILIVDKTPPELKVLKPSEEGRFNGKIDIMGTGSDNSQLESVTVELRQGDKANYAVPSFIQGLYLDGHFLGASTWEVGVGLTFFDDNVKLQADFGQAPVGGRFDGYVMGAKLIANIATLPFSYLFGPDWDFFSMSLAVGAQFDYFTMSGAELNFDHTGVVLGSAILQWEFARFHLAGWSVFRNISLYTEEQFWFISSDVQAGISFKTTFGARISIF